MEEWQREHITKNLSQLIFRTKFNTAVKVELQANTILSYADIYSLDAKEKSSGQLEASRHYYQLLIGRKDAYKVLVKVLMQFSQSGAAEILIRVPPELYTKPLTYLGISIKLKNFQGTNIEVHGKTIKIQEFFPGVDYEKLQQVFLSCLTELEIYDTFITKQRIFVLISDSVPLKPSYYVPRYLSNRFKINEAIFKTDWSDVFVFKNIKARYKLSEIARPHSTTDSTSQLTKITFRFIYLVENEDWIKLKKLSKEPIHLINFDAKEKSFLLEDTSTPSEIPRKFGSERHYLSEVDLVKQQFSGNSTSSSVCICDTPGMGKTLLLANIARLMTEKSVARIIVFIPLSLFSTHLHLPSWNNDTGILSVLKYISASSQHKDLLLKLIQDKLLRMEIFFDGFDEVPSDELELVKQVFLSIATTIPNVRMYITSRPHVKEELEKNVSGIAYDILPFNHQNQVDYLVQFWQSTKLISFQSSLQSYATSCLNAVNQSLTICDKEIAGIPLLCQLIAEIYADTASFHSFKKRKFCDVPQKLSDMYQKFIDKKIDLVTKNCKTLFDDFKLVHFWHALRLIFPTKQFHKEVQFKKISLLLGSPKMLKIGILQKHPNKTSEFIHRTFAEYFVAEYFSNKLQQKETPTSEKMTIFKLLLKCHTRKYEFMHPVVVSFFNSVIGEVNISEQLKIKAAAFVSSILHTEFIHILIICCRHDLLNIFAFLKKALKKCDSCRVRQIFTDKNSYELLSFCIGWSNSQILQICIELLKELKLDITSINTFKKDKTLLKWAIGCVNYDAVEYLVNKVSLKNQDILGCCVSIFWFSRDSKKVEDILHLLHNKDPTLIHESQDILLKYGLNVRLFKILVQFGAILTAVESGSNQNCAMCAAKYMSPDEYHKLVQFLLMECKAAYLFLDNEKWVHPVPKIIFSATLLPETLELLLNIPGLDVNMKDVNDENLLFKAVARNTVKILEQLFKRGLDYNARGESNRSLLHVAAAYGGVEMVRYLLSLKLDPNDREEYRYTPLHYASSSLNHENFSVVEVLVENGANVNAKNCRGKTALHLLASNGSTSSTRIIEYLIGKGAGVNEYDEDGNTPLHLCLHEEVRDLLIKMGAGIHVKNKKGLTPAQNPPDFGNLPTITSSQNTTYLELYI